MGHVRQAKFCLRVCQVVFLWVLQFSPHLLNGTSHMSGNNLERDVKFKKKKKKKKYNKKTLENVFMKHYATNWYLTFKM